MFYKTPLPFYPPEKIAELIPKFRKLKTYKEKLNFWLENQLDIGTTTYGITDEPIKRDLPENNITIYPNNKEEIKAYNKFYYELFQRHNFNTLQTSIEKYWRQIEQGANPIDYTKNVIAEIDKEYKANNKFPDTGFNSLRSYCNGYDASANGQIEYFLNSSSFHNNLLFFFTGEVHEKYKRFLVKQLKHLESPKPQMFNVHEKLEISCRLIGENKANTTQLIFHHIPYIINYFSITPLEARNILLELSGANTPNTNAKVVEKIITHIERVYPEILTVKPQQQNKSVIETEKSKPLQSTFTIKDFENFIYGCDGILINAKAEIIEWQPHFEKEQWESNSFLANGMMKTAQRIWDGKYEGNPASGENIYKKAHLSRTHIKHIILVEQNTIVIPHLKSEIKKICDKIIKFKDDNNMFDANILPNNHWFSELWGIVMKYKEWFDELIKPIENPLPSQQIKIINKVDEIKEQITSAPLANEPLYDKSIYTSYKGFQIFEAFKNEIITEATEYADYSFLFDKLKTDNLIHDMKHKKFILYLSENHNSLLASKGYKQFKFSSTKLKLKTYSRFKKQFQ